MSKIRTGITTEAEFRRIINEKGGNLKIDSTPETVLREISNTGSAISFGSPFTEILKSVNEESPLEPIDVEGEVITERFVNNTIGVDNLDFIVTQVEDEYYLYIDTRKVDLGDNIIGAAMLDGDGSILDDIEFREATGFDVNTPFVFNSNEIASGIGIMSLGKVPPVVTYEDNMDENVNVDWVVTFNATEEEYPKVVGVKLSPTDNPPIGENAKISLEVVNSVSKMFSISDLRDGRDVLYGFMIYEGSPEIIIKEAKY